MDNSLRIGANVVDYALVIVSFAVVLLIGWAARRRVSDSLDFFLSGRSLAAWITGLAFISANLGAVEIIGMSANGAEYGMATMHYYWIGAVPAMLFLGVVMMPSTAGRRFAASRVHAPAVRHGRTPDMEGLPVKWQGGRAARWVVGVE
jgi:SSS family solute:Na+ symporter